MGAFTVADLRRALEWVPDHLPVSIHVQMEQYGDLKEIGEIVPAYDTIVINVEGVGESLVIRM